MLINLNGMYNTYDEFTNFMELNDYKFISYDQGALQAFYKNKTDNLPIYFNYKPYWGINNDAKIIHYHGPKYNHIMNYLNDSEKGIPLLYIRLLNMIDKDSWKYFILLYETYESDFD